MPIFFVRQATIKQSTRKIDTEKADTCNNPSKTMGA